MRTIKRIISILYWDMHEQEWSGFKILFTFLMIFLFTMAFFNQKEEFKKLNCDSGIVLKDCLSQMMNTSNGWFLEIGFIKFEEKASIEKLHKICIKLASNCKN